MTDTMRTLMIVCAVLSMLLSVTVSSWADDCSRYFKAIKSWTSLKQDNHGKCKMENVPVGSGYPADSIPYKLRNGKELCPKNRSEMDKEYLWKNGKRISGTYYYTSETRMTLAYDESFIPSGPVRIYRNEKLFCEVPVNREGKPDGIVKEYNPEGKQINGFRMVDGKQKGGSVIFDENGKLKSFACEDKPLFNGDQERCGFNGKPAKVTLSNGTILTHMDGKLIAKETTNANGSKTVNQYSYSNTGEVTVQLMEYHKNGKLYQNFSVINEKREGKYLEYADNGKLKMEKEYKNGVDMTEKIYYMNGKLKEDSIRNPDGKSMSVKSYWDNGQLQSAGVFAFKGRGYGSTIPVGKAYKYAENGSLREEANYDQEGKLDGARILIDEKGKRTESVYRKGKLLAKKVFSADGKLELTEEYYEDGSRK